MSAVSGFVFSHLIDADVLDLESSIFTPRLPRHPALKGSQVDQIALMHPRFDLDAATSTVGCMDPTETFQVVSVWLHGVAMSQTLDLELYRLNLDSTTSALGSNDPIQVL
ncbi:hypothetical protein SCLCIDRAFT_24902 [Scleroderma citrinum Foug A]|uniref:Uncharacterized protein n=1 Tax=Scleroderma citrinum Foug A TaxID=1036808 RepID=A0A0C2ZM32_9AGAM|nr:hypothetical protein SCLCIDRAFT_24902 [Scleroderma citrinum Foug A]